MSVPTVYRGALTALALGVIHFIVALWLGERPLAVYFTLVYFREIALFLLVPWLVWACLEVVAAAKARAASPARFIAAKVGKERHRFINAGMFLLAYALVNRSYRAVKVAIPRLQEFYADPYFIDFDRILFGTDPWRLTHALFGEIGTRFFDWAYVVWLSVVLLTYGIAAFARDGRVQAQACLTYLLVWILLGNGLALAMSSVGPAFYDDFFGSDYFAPLMQRLTGQGGLTALNIQAYLLSATGDEAIGTGISAMPSVHCGLTMFIVLLVNRTVGWRWAMLALAYHLTILVGSVHLGWHYAVDGLLSTLLVPLIWWVVGKFLTLSKQREPNSNT